MPDKTYDILIDIRATQAQVLKQLQDGMASVRKEAEGFNNAFKIGGAVEITRLLSEQIRRIPELLRESIAEGIAFNKLLEQSRLGVAGVLRQFDAGSYRDFNAALVDSDKVIGLLQQKANQLGLSFEAMLEQYRTTANALFAGGVRDLQKQVDLTVLLQQAMASLGISGFQAQRDIFDLLEGRSARTIAGRALGISDADIEKAKEAGQLGEFLTEKFQAISEAGKAIGTTFGAAEQRTRNLAEQLKGVATIDVFKELKNDLDALNASLAGNEARESARGIGNVISESYSALKQIGISVVDTFKAIDHYLYVPEKILQLEKATIFKGYVDAFNVGAAREFVDLATKAQKLVIDEVVNANTITQQKHAQKDLDIAIAALEEKVRTSEGDTKVFAEQFLQSLQNVRALFPEIAGSAERVARSLQLSAEQADKIIKGATVLQSFDRSAAIRGGQIRGDDAQVFEIQKQQTYDETFRKIFSATGDALDAARRAQTEVNLLVKEHEKELENQRQGLALTKEETEGIKLIADGRESEGNTLKRNAEIARLMTQYSKEFGIGEEEARAMATERVDAEAKVKDAKSGQRDAQRDINNLLRESTAILRDIRAQQQLVSESPFLSADQKQSRLHDLFSQEQEALIPQIARVKEALQEAYGAGNQAEIDRLKEKLNELGVETIQLGFKIQTSNFTGALHKELVDWVNSFGTSAHAVASIITGTLNTAIASTSQALTGLIFGTLNWRQAFNQAAQSIVQNILQILLQWVISRTIMAALNKAFGKADAQASAALATQSASAWSAAAISASIATEGIAAATGTAAYLAALGAGQAGAIASSAGGSFDVGGFTGGVEGRPVRAVLHGEEHVQPARTVRKYGVDLFEAFRFGRIPVAAARALISGLTIPVNPRLGSFEVGGPVASIGSDSDSSPFGSKTEVHVFNFTDVDQLAEAVANSKANQKIIVETISGRKVELFGARAA